MNINLNHLRVIGIRYLSADAKDITPGFKEELQWLHRQGTPLPLSRVVPHRSSPLSYPQAGACAIRGIHPARPRLKTFLPQHMCHMPRRRACKEKNYTLLPEVFSTALDYISQGPSRSRLLPVERPSWLMVQVPREGHLRRKSSVESSVETCVLNAAWNSLTLCQR